MGNLLAVQACKLKNALVEPPRLERWCGVMTMQVGLGYGEDYEDEDEDMLPAAAAAASGGDSCLIPL
jgi:hypothetical protein